MAKKSLKEICPKAFEPIKSEGYKPSAYTSEERYQMFAERKIVAPTPHKNKKAYTRKSKHQKKDW